MLKVSKKLKRKHLNAFNAMLSSNFFVLIFILFSIARADDDKKNNQNVKLFAFRILSHRYCTSKGFEIEKMAKNVPTHDTFNFANQIEIKKSFWIMSNQLQ